MGYYNKRREEFLKALDRTTLLTKGLLVARYGKDLASVLQKKVCQEYEKLIPEISLALQESLT